MARIRTALRVLALSVSSVAIACGDGEAQLDPGSSANAGGGGGSAQTGGSAPQTGGNTGWVTTGGAPSLGGSGSITTASGGSSATGGTTPGTSTAGAMNTAGGSGTTTAGGSGSGGTVAQTSVGGTAAGGTTTTLVGGDSSIGGTGPLPTGGAQSTTGGAATGGAATGGAATGGTSAITCAASYVAPTDNQALANAEDLDGNCSNGIQFNVVVATNAPDGTAATLSLALSSGDSTQIASTAVAGAVARFNNVTLPASGQVTLTASVAGSSCAATGAISLSCEGAPGCTITSPSITDAHPALNGVAAPQGDRISSVGAPYQVAFEVSTDVRDGQPVVLTVDGSTNYQTTASAGKARFGGVLMAPDGSHAAQATCTAGSGLKSTTPLLTFPVDTTPPNLTPQKGTGASGATLSALNNSDHYAATDDADPADGLQIRFCGATTSSDAVDIPSVNPSANNFCVRRGNNAPSCAPVLTANGGDNPAGTYGCVNVDCPGDGPFSVELSITDAAGNPTTITRSGITCASTSPSVTFIEPVSDSGQFTDVAKRILAADNNNAETVRRDKNASKAGAQYDVFACTSAAAGSTAILYTGYMGQTLNQTAMTTVVADSGTTPICAGGNLIAFSSSVVTLPESLTDSSFNLSIATELRIVVTDLNLATGSAVADVWVDSVSPALTLVSPNPFCGQYYNTSGNPLVPVTMVFGSSIPVTVSVTASSGTQTFSGNSVFSQATVVANLLPGTNTVSAWSQKPSGNYGTFAACDVTAGATPPPAVTWQSPVNTSMLTAQGNTGANKIADGSVDPGWQGVLKVCTDVDATAYPTASVLFTATVGTTVTTLGSAPLVADGTCPSGRTSSATLENATVPDGGSVILTATTSQIGDSTGTGTITVPVASTAPGQVTITGVEITDRRRTSFTPKWTAASGNPTGYVVRVSKAAIVTQNDFDNAHNVPYTGGGTCPVEGCSVLVDKCYVDQTSSAVHDCYIENDYYFAVAPIDSVGNNGQFAATLTATRAKFNQVSIPPPTAGQRFAYAFDGSSDLNGDGFSDLLVGYSNGLNVHIYLGSANGLPSTPSVTIQGSASAFGQSVAVIGDIDGDKLPDIAVGSPREGNGVVYVYLGRINWPATLTATNADCVISANATTDTKYGASFFGLQVVGIGRFNSDELDDFAISAPFYNGLQGQVAVIYGKSAPFDTNIELPSAFGARATRIDGDLTFQGALGVALTGLGPSYGNGINATLVASAPYGPSNAYNGRLYAFLGQNGTPASIDIASPLATVTGATGQLYGALQVSSLGSIGNAIQPALGVNTRSQAGGDIRSGTTLSGPFTNLLTIGTTDSSAANKFGSMFIGGGFSGKNGHVSVVGSAQSDILVTTTAGSGPRLFIIDGSDLVYGSNVKAETKADVELRLPGTWTDFSANGTMLYDINGDKYADIAIAETTYTENLIDGKILVLY